MADDNSINNEQNMADEVLMMSEERLRSILRAALDGFWMFNLEGRLLEVNDAYSQISGYSESELLTMRVSDLEILETLEMVAARIAMIVEQGEVRFKTQHRRKDGSIIDLEVSALYQTFAGGRIIAFLRDISESKEAEQALQDEHKLYEDLVNTLPAGVYRLRAKLCGNWETKTWRSFMETQYSTDMASDRFCAILGISLNAIIASPGIVPDMIHPDDKEDFNARNAQAMTGLHPFIWEGRIICNQQTKWVHFESLPRVIDAETVLWTGIVYEITERKQEQEALRNSEERFRGLSFIDPLTGLSNRRLFEDRLEQAIATSRRNGTRFGLLTLDLDKFKELNDTFGHEAGDQVLCEAADRLRVCCKRDIDTISRQGGDEFCIILNDCGDRGHLSAIADRLLQQFERPFQLDDSQVEVTTSIGISVFPDNGTVKKELEIASDRAMYVAKKTGGNNYRFWEPYTEPSNTY